MTPFHAATRYWSSGEKVAKPWPPVPGIPCTLGVGGASRVTSMTHSESETFIDCVGAAMYLPSRDTT
jgi:hypothetical protein